MAIVYQLRAALTGVEPEVWRRVRVPSDLPLAELHDVLQAAMGWQDVHLHEFVRGPRRYGPTGPDGLDGVVDEWSVAVCDVLRRAGERLSYVYDRRARWTHDVLLEACIEVRGPGGSLPLCLDGGRACPPEGCGGPRRYRELLAAGSAKGGGRQPPRGEPGFDPDRMDVAEANGRIEALFSECWVGGVLPLPAEVAADLPVPHSLVVWLDRRYGTVVGRDVVPAADGTEAAVAAVVRVLGDVGFEGRAPVRLRVEDPDLAARLRLRLGSSAEIEQGPTPELDEVREAIAEGIAAQNGTAAEATSYLDGGRIEPARMARFFRAASELYRSSPWKVLGHGDLIVVESEPLGLEGAVALVAGESVEDFGLLLFDCAEDCATFLEGRGLCGCSESPDVPTRIVHFARGADVPPPMRREIGRHLWEVADAHAYPLLALLDRDGVARRIDDPELARLTACVEAVSSLVVRRSEDIGAGRPVAERVVVDGLPGSATVRVRVGVRSSAGRREGESPEDDDDGAVANGPRQPCPRAVPGRHP